MPTQTASSAAANTASAIRELCALPIGDPNRARLRALVIVENMPLAERLARRYAGRGEHYDDLAQVAALALVRAVDCFDPDRCAPFTSYAIPTILGALKRHFRDHAWAMRVPRSTQQLVLEIGVAIGELSQLRGRMPTATDLAEHLQTDLLDIQVALGAAQTYQLASLNALQPSMDNTELIDLVGDTDPHYRGVEDQLTLDPLLAALSPRERRIIMLRFYEEQTQDRIASELGISQMHVSRLLKRSLAQLKAGMMERRPA